MDRRTESVPRDGEGRHDDGSGGAGDQGAANVIRGTRGDDSLVGSDVDDLIRGRDGDDTLIASNSFMPVRASDTLEGGRGDDSLFGWFGADRLLGGPGADTLLGGDNELDGGSDYLSGGRGNDVLDGLKGADTLLGGAGEDVFSFRIGITGPAPSSTTRPGEANRDVILDFQQGKDVIDLSEWQTFFRPVRDNPENSFLGTGAFRGFEDLEIRYEIQGDRTIVQIRSATNETWFLPTEGEIELKGRIHLTAADFFLGRPGDDGQPGDGGTPGDGGQPGEDPPVPPGDTPGAIVGTEGDDSLPGTVASDLILGRAGNDTLNSADFGNSRGTADTLFGEAGDDSIIGGPVSDDRLFGGPGADTLRGGDVPFENGRDFLSGGDGNDLLYGSPGDTLRGGEGEDTFLFATSFKDGYFPASPAGPDTSNVILDFEPGRDVIEFFFKNFSPVDEAAVFLGTGAFTRDETAAQIRYEIRGDSTFVQTFEVGRSAAGIGSVRPDIRQEVELKGHYALTAADFVFGERGDTGHPGDGGGPGHDGLPGEEPPPSSTPGAILGTEGPDTLGGTRGDDLIIGFGGNDALAGSRFGQFNFDQADTVYGGEGNDFLGGFLGASYLFGGPGNDALRTGDREFGGSSDYLSGGPGNDTLDGGPSGGDTFRGGEGEDVFEFLVGTRGPTIVSPTSPGPGRDVILDFEQGKDVIDLSEWQTAFAPPLDCPEEAFLGTGDFTTGDDLQIRYEIRGDITVVQIRGASGPTYSYPPTVGEIGLTGRLDLTADDFRVTSGQGMGDGSCDPPPPAPEGPTTLAGTDESERLTGNGWSELILGKGGDDVLWANWSVFYPDRPDLADTLLGGDGNDYIIGNPHADLIEGEEGDDNLDGGGLFLPFAGLTPEELRSGGDTLSGGPGNDGITSGPGTDMLSGGSGNDVFGFGLNFLPEIPSTGTGEGNRDVILDFAQGSDLIDLSEWQGNGGPAPVFLGTDPFGEDGPLQLRYDIEGDVTVVQIRSATSAFRPEPAEGEIELRGSYALTAGDFILGG